MASVFLSYDREDGAKARVIAQALERAGHSVWWDRHIRSGAQYSKEIEVALKAADAVIVMWSERSVESPWVRDEAAAGRDTGRLVPVLLDNTDPPLGFRQYQATDLSGWNGRGTPPLGGMAAAICELAGGRTDMPAQTIAAGHSAGPQSSLKRWAGVGALALALIAAGLFLWEPWKTAQRVPIVAVLAADDGAETKAFASDLLVKLGSLQSSRADSLQLVEPGTKLNVDYSFKVGGVGGEGERRANLALIDRSGTLLWSQEFNQPGGNQADLRQQVAYSAGQVLRCATDALAPGHSKLDLPTLKLFLNGCAHFSDMTAEDARALVPALQKVTDRVPDFAGGWSKLVLAQMFAFRQTGMQDKAMRDSLRASIGRARRAHPGLADADLAEAWVQPSRPISAWMHFTEKAVERAPDHAEALMNRATGYLHLGRCQEAIDDSRRAARAEPLYPAARNALVETLAHCGRPEEAKRELQESERLWPGATNVRQSRFLFEYLYGNPSAAAQLLREGAAQVAPTPARFSFLKARMYPSKVNVAEAISQAYADWQGRKGYASYVQTLGHFGQTDEAAKVLLSTDPELVPGIIWTLFGPQFRDLRRDPRFMQIAHRLELIPYWQESGKWPDFCFEPDLPYDCKAVAAKLS